MEVCRNLLKEDDVSILEIVKIIFIRFHLLWKVELVSGDVEVYRNLLKKDEIYISIYYMNII